LSEEGADPPGYSPGRLALSSIDAGAESGNGAGAGTFVEAARSVSLGVPSAQISISRFIRSILVKLLLVKERPPPDPEIPTASYQMQNRFAVLHDVRKATQFPEGVPAIFSDSWLFIQSG